MNKVFEQGSKHFKGLATNEIYNQIGPHFIWHR